MTKPKNGNWLGHLLAVGFQAFAKDAEPDEVAEAMDAMKKAAADDEFPDDLKKKEAKEAEDRKRAADAKAAEEDKRAKDAEAEAERKKEEDRKKAEDAAAKDSKRQRYHDALDKMLDEMHPSVEGEVPVEGEDADLDELRELLDEYFQEEGQEPEHAESSEDRHHARDRFVTPVDEGRRGNADRRVASDRMALLDELRPTVAKSKDADVKRVFNAILRAEVNGSVAGTGTYGGFARGARARARDAGQDPTQRRGGNDPQKIVELQTKYNELFAGKKEGGK